MRPKFATSPDVSPARYSLLLLVGAVEDKDAVFSQFPWHTRTARCFREALPLICRDLARVVLCEGALHDGSWKDVLELAASRPYPPPLIVTSRLADERLWAEVLNLGGYDVLAQPLDRAEALRAIRLAWDHWESHDECELRAVGAPAK